MRKRKITPIANLPTATDAVREVAPIPTTLSDDNYTKPTVAPLNESKLSVIGYSPAVPLSQQRLTEAINAIAKASKAFEALGKAAASIKPPTFMGIPIKVSNYVKGDDVYVAPNGDHHVSPANFAKLQGFKLGTEDLE